MPDVETRLVPNPVDWAVGCFWNGATKPDTDSLARTHGRKVNGSGTPRCTRLPSSPRGIRSCMRSLGFAAPEGI
jgi:hypothetical protein